MELTKPTNSDLGTECIAINKFQVQAVECSVIIFT